jgi:class 3 adenylate cyclase
MRQTISALTDRCASATTSASVTAMPRSAPSASRAALAMRRSGTVSNLASRLCDEAQPGQILISPRVLLAVENAATAEPAGDFALKGLRRPMTRLQRYLDRTRKS